MNTQNGQHNAQLKKHVVFQLLIIVAIFALIIILVISLLPLLREILRNTGDDAKIASDVQAYGPKGIPMLIGLQVLQGLIAIIPLPAVQVVAGLLYGPIWGTIYVMVGTILSNVIVFATMRRAQHLIAPFLKHNKHKQHFTKEKLEHMKRPVLVALLLFLIPVIPDGIVPYVFAETKVSLAKYILVVALGAFPSTFIYILLGNRISTGGFKTAIIMGIVILALMLVVLLFKKKIMARILHVGSPMSWHLEQ